MIKLFCCKPCAQSGTQAQDPKGLWLNPQHNQLISKCQPHWNCCSYHWATAWSVGEHDSYFTEPGAPAQGVWIGCKGHKVHERLWSSKAWPLSWSMLTASISHLKACHGICSMPELCFCWKQLGQLPVGTEPKHFTCGYLPVEKEPPRHERENQRWRKVEKMTLPRRRLRQHHHTSHRSICPTSLKMEVCEGVFTDMTACTALRLTASYFKMKENKRTFNLETKYSFPTVSSVQD